MDIACSLSCPDPFKIIKLYRRTIPIPYPSKIQFHDPKPSAYILFIIPKFFFTVYRNGPNLQHPLIHIPFLCFIAVHKRWQSGISPRRRGSGSVVGCAHALRCGHREGNALPARARVHAQGSHV